MQGAIRSAKNQRPPITRSIIRQRQQEAFSIKPEWEKFASADLVKLVGDYAAAVGCPNEFVFFPLLTSAAAMLGRDTSIKLTDLWNEPAVLWTIVAARKGEKKSAAMRIISNAVRQTEKDAQQFFLEQEENQHLKPEDGENFTEEALQALPQFTMTNSQFTFSKLHDQMAKNDGECLLMYDEIAALYDQLDHQGNGSQCDRKILLSLYGGDPWSRSTKAAGTTTLETTHFNYTGFMQPTIAISMLNVDDFDGFNDRHVAIICPERNKVYFEDLKAIDPQSTKILSTVFTLLRRKHHETKIVYVLTEEANSSFKAFYNDLEDRIEMSSDSEDHRGVLSKAQGQTARLALVLHTLSYAVEHREKPYANFNIPSEIGNQILKSAISLMEFCIQQKFALMPPPSQESENPPCPFDKVWETHPRNVRSLMECEPVEVDASYVAQRRLLPPQKSTDSTSNKYPVAAAKKYLGVLAEAGLGDLVQPQGSGSKKRASTVLFRKRSFDTMNEDAKMILQSLQVDLDVYSQKVKKTS